MQGLHGFVNLMYNAKRNLDNDCETSFPLTSCLGLDNIVWGATIILRTLVLCE